MREQAELLAISAVEGCDAAHDDITVADELAAYQVRNCRGGDGLSPVTAARFSHEGWRNHRVGGVLGGRACTPAGRVVGPAGAAAAFGMVRSFGHHALGDVEVLVRSHDEGRVGHIEDERIAALGTQIVERLAHVVHDGRHELFLTRLRLLAQRTDTNLERVLFRDQRALTLLERGRAQCRRLLVERLLQLAERVAQLLNLLVRTFPRRDLNCRLSLGRTGCGLQDRLRIDERELLTARLGLRRIGGRSSTSASAPAKKNERM